MHIFIYTYLFLARQCSCLSVFEWDNVVKLISHGCGAASGWGPASPRRKIRQQQLGVARLRWGAKEATDERGDRALESAAELAPPAAVPLYISKN